MAAFETPYVVHLQVGNCGLWAARRRGEGGWGIYCKRNGKVKEEEAGVKKDFAGVRRRMQE
jgi:hypothetical protein